jgi:glycosyltransferase involved in cell wall biosynthesis
MQTRGHDVALWTPSSRDPGAASHWIPSDVSVRVIPFPDEPSRSRLSRRYFSELDTVRWRVSVLEEHARKVCDAMAQWGADVLVAHPGWWFHTSPIGARWKGSSLLYLQEPNRFLYESLPENRWAARQRNNSKGLRSKAGSVIQDWRSIYQYRLQVRTEIDWARQFDRILVNSLYSRESVARAYGLDAYFCPLGANHAKFGDATPRTKRRTVVSLGEFTHHKGPDLAVRAVSHVPANRRPSLRWFGNRVADSYLRDVQALAEQLQVDFSFRHMAPDDELAAALSEAACMVYCPRLEPLGLAPLEANFAGTAVVAVAEGGVRETVVPGVNGALVLSRDPAELGAAVDLYTNNLDFAMSAGQAAREHVRIHHTWEAAGSALERNILAAMAHTHRSLSEQRCADLTNCSVPALEIGAQSD